MRSAEINRLNIAYAKTLRMLDLVDRFDPVTEIVAKKVINVGTPRSKGGRNGHCAHEYRNIEKLLFVP
jgi:hypothetical protein